MDPKSYTELDRLRHELMVAENRLAQKFTKNELRSAKKKALEGMTSRAASDLGLSAGSQAWKVDEALEWIPYDILNALRHEGYAFDISRQSSSKLRAFFRSSERLCRVAKDSSPQTWAHELSHAIDDYLSGNRDTGLIWRDTIFGAESAFGTEAEAKSLQKWFDKQHSGMKGKYRNGDGDYWRDNWLSDYEGRIYDGRAAGTQGQEWWAMNCQRYSEYVYRRDVGYLKRVAELEQDVIRWEGLAAEIRSELAAGEWTTAAGKKGVEEQLASVEHSIREYQHDIKRFKTDPEARDKWAAMLSQWRRARQLYPELTAFIENKFKGDFIASW